jgi:hypothetical protein
VDRDRRRVPRAPRRLRSRAVLPVIPA